MHFYKKLNQIEIQTEISKPFKKKVGRKVTERTPRTTLFGHQENKIVLIMVSIQREHISRSINIKKEACQRTRSVVKFQISIALT